MKRILSTIILLFLSCSIFAQEVAEFVTGVWHIKINVAGLGLIRDGDYKCVLYISSDHKSFLFKSQKNFNTWIEAKLK